MSHLKPSTALKYPCKIFWEIEEVLLESPNSMKKNFFRRTITPVLQNATKQVVLSFNYLLKTILYLWVILFQLPRDVFLVWKKLSKLPEVKTQYIDLINEFLGLGHMELIPPFEIDIEPSESFHILHHFVTNSDSATTKLRAVFDASAKTTSNTSLNSNLKVGLKMQSDFSDNLLRLRFHNFVLSAEIAKKYRQVALDKPDRDFHRVLRRETENKPLQHRRMTRVCYGITSADYQSIRSSFCGRVS